MYSSLQMFVKYAKYWLTSANSKGHGIHSPFVFQFVVDILNDDRFFYAFETLEATPNKLKSSLRKYNRLLFKIVNYYQPKKILLISQNGDITSSYLSAANEKAIITELHSINKNTDLINQNWDMLIINEPVSTQLQNHLEALISSLQASSYIIIKNIHESAAIEAIWANIKHQSTATLTIDLFHIGFVFFRQENKVPQHFTIRF